MCTAHALTVSPSMLCRGCLLLGGVCSRGVCLLGGVCSRGVSALGGVCLLWGRVSAPGGVSTPKGVSALGGVCSWGQSAPGDVSVLGGVCSGGGCLLLGGVCFQGGVCSGGMSAPGGVCSGGVGVCSGGWGGVGGVCSGGVCSRGVFALGGVSQHAIRSGPMTCSNCKSPDHLIRDCPEPNNRQQTQSHNRQNNPLENTIEIITQALKSLLSNQNTHGHNKPKQPFYHNRTNC